MLKKSLKIIVLIVLVLLLLVMGISYFLLNTTAGLKQAVGLANQYSGYQVNVGSVEGKLLKKTAIKQLSVQGDNLQFTADNVVLDWDSGALFDKSVKVKSVIINDAELLLKPTETAKKSNKPFTLSDIELPFSADIEDLQINNLTIKNPVTEKADFVIEHFKLGIDYIGQTGTIHTLDFKAQGIDLKMTGNVVTKGDFPIHLENRTAYASTAYGNQIIDATISGELKKDLAININGEGLSDFQLTGQAKDLFAKPDFSADLNIKSVKTEQFDLADTTLHADLSVKGQYQLDSGVVALTADGEAFYDSPQTNKLKAVFLAEFDGESVVLPQLTVDLLTAKQQITGQGSYRLNDQQFSLQLDSDALHWAQNAENPPVVAKQLSVMANGTPNQYTAKVTTDAHTDFAGVVPLTINATGDSQQLTDVNINALLNQQPIDVVGKATWSPTLNYAVNVKAPSIKAFQSVPNIKQLDMNVSGDDKIFSAKGKLAVSADNIPPTQATLDANGSYTHLEAANVVLETLGGQATVSATGDLSPLDIQANVATKNIQPQTFYPDIQGNINSQFVMTAQQTADNLLATATIEQLDGKLQGYPLNGKGKVAFNQADNVVSVQDLLVNVAGNRLTADGVLALDTTLGQSTLKANVDAKDLKRLLPDLRGSLVADIVAKGNLSNPEVKAVIKGSQLAYQGHQAKSLLADANISLAQDKVMITATASGIQTGETVIDKADINVKGKISAHQLTAKVNNPKGSAIPNVAIKGQGGLDTQQLLWSGKLSQLNLDNELAGKWQLSKPTAINVGAEKIRINQLCLQQKQAALCADGQMQGSKGDFDVVIKQVKTQQFSRYLPDNIDINTTLSGKAKLSLADGKPTLSGNLVTKGGRLSLQTGQGALSSTIKRFDTKVALKNNRLESVIDAELSKLGAIKVQAVLPDLNQSDIQAKINIDNKSLKFIEEIAPQISNVKGHLSGDMTLSGVPGKQLNVGGKITLHQTDFDVPQFGSEIREMTLDIFALNGNKLGFKGGAKAGSGHFDVDGSINPANQQGEINLKGKDFQVANSKKLKVVIDPDLRLVFAEKIQIRGEVAIPTAMIVPESTGSKITASEDVVMPSSKPQKQATNSPLDVEVKVKLGDDVRVASADIETRLQGGLNIKAKPGKTPTAGGVIEVQTGELRIYGQLLNIERGRVIFSHGPIANPALDIRTTRVIDSEDITVGANVLGTAQKPEISLFSTPSMPDSSILSYLLFGRPPNSDSFGSTALLQTGGLVGANALARDMRSSVGLDVLDFSLTGMEAGKNLSKKLYAGMRSSFFDALNEFLLEYKISGKLKAEGTVNNNGQAAGDLIYLFETD